MAAEFTITDGAAKKIRSLLVGAEAGQGLRVRVVEGGCSGFEYEVAIDSPAIDDRIFENTGARVLLDAKSFLHLSGAQVDYRSGLMQSSFVFTNPNVTATCGCGTSFSA